MTWRPAHADGYYGTGRPTIGAVVAYAHRAWEVIHIGEAILTPEEEERLAHYTPAGRAKMLPYRVSLRRLHGEPHEHENDRQECGLRIPIGWPLPTYPNGRVPLCSCHGHPWPCLESEQQAQAEKEIAAAEKALNLLPGCCPACSEVVTSRQRSCPSVYAQHRGYCACYVQTHGCGQGCSPTGHPGTRIAGRPLDPRAVTA